MLNQCINNKSKANLLLKVEKQLELCFRNNKKFPRQVMNKVANQLSCIGKNELRDIISFILNDNDLMVKISSKSYLQGNGFYKIVLSETQNYVLRLHVWMPGTEAQENLHSHRWYFASSIITGELHSEVWEDSVCKSDLSYPEYIYLGKNRDVENIGTAKVKYIKTLIHKEGEVYTLSPDILHRIVQNYEAITITLMCRPLYGKMWSRNISVNGVTPHVIPSFMSCKELSKIFNIVISTLE